MTRKNILFISNSGSIGGAQKCLLDLISRLPYDLKPIVLIPNNGHLEVLLNDLNIEYCIVPFRGWWYSIFRLKLIERLLNNMRCLIYVLFKFRRVKIDLVYTNTMYSPFGAALAYVLNVPHVWHIHEFSHLNHIQKFDFGKRLSFKFINSTSDIILCPSLALKNDLADYLNFEKIFVIHNGIEILINELNVNNFERKNFELKNLIIIGSIIEFKGHKDGILLIENLKNLGYNVFLNIVGDGSVTYVEYLKKFANDLGVAENINWLGFQEDISYYINQSDILIVCSHHETFGMTILEAMNIKCPVIASRVGGITEIIDDGYNGLLYNPGDINMLTNCFLRLENLELYDRICLNGTKIIDLKFNVEFYAVSVINKIKWLLTK